VIRVEDIRSFTDFTRHANAHLKRLKQTGHPIVLTINGKAEVVVQAAAAYQRLLQAEEKSRKPSRRKIFMAGTTS
jgi:PHD/YefM family antitoxin component YafN of YafNO toxin-antitoxin module